VTERRRSLFGSMSPMSGPPFLRPFQGNERRPNADGSYSTELTATVQLPDGSWSNVPSLWMGPQGPVELNEEEQIMRAMQFFENTGAEFNRYGTLDEAEREAVARSKAGGVGTGPLYRRR
jgi:hypothetical protein